MVYPKIVEHGKNYLVQMQLFDEVAFEEPVKLNYLTTSFEINQTSGSDFINQKGRNIASAFAKQPNVSVSFRCYMTEPDFAIVISNLILNQQQILITVGKLKDKLGKRFFESQSNEILDAFSSVGNIFLSNAVIDPSVTIYEIIGYMKDAKIAATVGEFVTVDITINADDVNEFDPNNLIDFKP